MDKKKRLIGVIFSSPGTEVARIFDQALVEITSVLQQQTGSSPLSGEGEERLPVPWPYRLSG